MTKAPQVIDERPWWLRWLTSKTVWGIVIMAASGALKEQGIVFTDAESGTMIDIVTNIGLGIGGLIALYGRAKARGPLLDASPLIALGLAALLLVGCAGDDGLEPERAALIGCSSYAGTLSSLADMNTAGVLPQQFVGYIDLLRPSLTAACLSPEVPTDLVDLVDASMRALLAMESGAPLDRVRELVTHALEIGGAQ